jgi:hypothetical protein
MIVQQQGLASDERAALVEAARRTQKPRDLQGFVDMGTAGFEPATSRV